MTPPRRRAEAYLNWLAQQPGDWRMRFHGAPVVADDVIDRLAEIIADAQDEVREGFLRKPSGRDPHTHH